MIRRILSAALALCLLLCVPASAAAGSSYSDVPPGDWSVSAIEKATEYGLMEGIGGARFGYGNVMDRASFAAVLQRIFRWPDARPAAPSFSDVAPDAWYYTAVETALANGAVEPGLYFRPKDEISRADMAVMLARALDYDQLAAALEDAPLPFPDVTRDRGYIALAYRFGIITGSPQPDGGLLFFPNRSAPREQAAAMLVRTYEKLYARTDFLHGFYAFGSYPQIAYSDAMDAVSVGWSRISVDGAGAAYLNSSPAGGNEWAVPSQSELATGHFRGNQTPYHLSVFASASDRAALPDGGTVSSVQAAVSTPEDRARVIAAIRDAAADYSGVTIDFESVRASLRAPFTAFITELKAALPAGKSLYVCVQPPDWFDGYDYRALGDVCDKVILMAHDYQSTSIPAGYVGSMRTDNPVTPLSSVYAALAALTDPDTGLRDSSKAVLAISFSSAGFRVDGEGRLVSQTVYSPGPSTLITRLRQSDAERGWSDVYRNPYVFYTAEDGNRYRIWYEDARSVTEKIRLARLFGVNGVSLWRLGTIPDYADPGLDYDVWSAVLAGR